MRELIERFFPPAPAEVCDVGCGPGAYSVWLAERGYVVHAIDAVARHVDQAKSAAATSGISLASINIGDARDIRASDASMDAVLIHGPLYHLTERTDRLQALREARRILCPGGVLLAVGVSRASSTIVGLINGWVSDPAYFEMCREELITGQHRRPANWPKLFTTAYFHEPDELRCEIEEAGLKCESILAIQGPGWLGPTFTERWQSPIDREAILKIIRVMEAFPAALVMSPHIMAVSRRP